MSIGARPAKGTPLTERERAVMALILRGQPAKVIGRELCISTRTVEFHRQNILAKTGSANTRALFAKALATSLGERSAA
jgi:LuxR family quorum-sensing system transcriptional regulator SolR